MRCSKCGSTNVTVDPQQTSSYSYSKGILGELILGPGGAVAGVGGKTTTNKQYHCMACGAIGNFYSVIMDANTESDIMLAFQYNDIAKLNSLKKKYRNIEWTSPFNNNGVSSADNSRDFQIFNGTLERHLQNRAFVEIPSGVKKIGKNAFSHQIRLETVKVPYSLTAIEESAFAFCEELKSINIPDGVVSIGPYAFNSCSKLKLEYPTLPKSLVSIGDSAFFGCWRLRTEIPSSVRSIGSSAFSCCDDLSTVVIPNGVKSIEYGTFSSCSSLTSVTIPDSLTIIGDRAFQDCGALPSVTIPDSVASIGKEAFKDCIELTSIKIPNNVAIIGANAFEGCKKLKSITFSDPHNWTLDIVRGGGTVRKPIREKVLCNPISAAKFVRKHCNATFTCNNKAKQDNLKKAVAEKSPFFQIENGILKKYTGVEENVKIPNGITSIGENAFSRCKLESITIPSSVISIEKRAFFDCTAKSITIPQGIASIGENAFLHCKIKSITIPRSVISIENNIFGGCSNLETISVEEGNLHYRSEGNCLIRIADNTLMSVCKNSKIPNYIEAIGKEAFFGCKNLTSITIPNSVTSIGESAFYGCEKLTSITIPNSVTSIGERAFNACENLTSIIIPKSVTSIKNNIIDGCNNLKTISVEEGNPNYRSDGNCLIRIADNTLMSCCKSSKIPDYIEVIGEAVFSCIPQKPNLVIPQNVKRIEAEAFWFCCSIKSVILPKSVAYIGAGAFYSDYDLSQLETFTFSDPQGWFLMTEKDNQGDPIDDKLLSDPKSAAEFIKNLKIGSYLCKKG